MLSPMDWALIEGWKERGVPLHVVVRAIEHAFDSHDAKKQKRTVTTLLYCQEEVEVQYAKRLETRCGSHDVGGRPEGDNRPPFPPPSDLKLPQTPFTDITQLAHYPEQK